MSKSETCSVNNIYRLNGRVPVTKAVPFGLQHILAMFVANLAPITIIAITVRIIDAINFSAKSFFMFFLSFF